MVQNTVACSQWWQYSDFVLLVLFAHEKYHISVYEILQIHILQKIFAWSFPKVWIFKSAASHVSAAAVHRFAVDFPPKTQCKRRNPYCWCKICKSKKKIRVSTWAENNNNKKRNYKLSVTTAAATCRISIYHHWRPGAQRVVLDQEALPSERQGIRMVSIVPILYFYFQLRCLFSCRASTWPSVQATKQQPVRKLTKKFETFFYGEEEIKLVFNTVLRLWTFVRISW